MNSLFVFASDEPMDDRLAGLMEQHVTRNSSVCVCCGLFFFLIRSSVQTHVIRPVQKATLGHFTLKQEACGEKDEPSALISHPPAI